MFFKSNQRQCVREAKGHVFSGVLTSVEHMFLRFVDSLVLLVSNEDSHYGRNDEDCDYPLKQ